MLHSLIARRRFGPQTQWWPLRKTLTSGLGLDNMSLAWRGRGSTIGFHLLWHTVELAMSTRLCLLQWLIWFLFFRFDALTEFGAFMRTKFLSIPVLIASGPRVKLVTCKSALTPHHPLPQPPPPSPRWFIDRPNAVVSVLILLLVALWFILQGDLCLTLCYFALVFFSPFSIAITLLGEEGANLSAFRTLLRFVLVWFCSCPLPLGFWEELRFVIFLWHSVDFSLIFFCFGLKFDTVYWKGVPILKVNEITQRLINSDLH